MEGFPQQLPQQALQALMGPIFGQKPFDKTAILAAYEIIGYGLGQALGDVQYNAIMGNEPHVANILAQAPPEVQAFMDFTNSQGDQLMQAESLPPWAAPFLQQLASWAIQKLLERLSKQESFSIGALTLKNTPQIAPSGGAFPERKLGVPSGTGVFTQSRPLPNSQSSGAQSQPSDQIQQPTGDAEKHPSVPQSSKSPQWQGNTVDPQNPTPVKPMFQDTQSAGAPASQPGGPSGPVTNSPGTTGTPGTGSTPVPKAATPPAPPAK